MWPELYHKSGFPLLYIVRILETRKMNEMLKRKLKLQMWIFPPQKFTCTVIPMRFTITENLQHMSNLLQQLNACFSPQLFLLLPESFFSGFVPAVFRNGNLKEGQTLKNRNLSKQAMCETDLARLLNRILCPKIQKRLCKGSATVEFTSNFLFSSFFPVIVAGHLPHYSYVTPSSD